MDKFSRAHCPAHACANLFVLRLQPLLDDYPKEGVLSESDLVTPTFSLKLYFPCWEDQPPPLAPVLSSAGSPKSHSRHVWPLHSYREVKKEKFKGFEYDAAYSRLHQCDSGPVNQWKSKRDYEKVRKTLCLQ
ncbi:hypothetical protein AV530_017047 [Patagioenas fasciata monilis]|uniref:Uncharacterized protein n=1 Tax=Patagioenas fasciata monilis TaxID=372326 RepID=A0A1V4J4J4_PATFA|nr:hypothetical protein AV530_017047 [Patagioenas fasciata monilis]